MTQPHMPNLPGFDAMADTLAFVKNMWGGVQASSGTPNMTMPTLSVDEINKQITDLKAVESWLNVNMNMLRGTIQALEVQSATITTLNAMGATFGAQMMPNAAPSSTPTSSTSSEDVFTQNTKPAADGNTLHANAGADAATAWWSALQTQFNQAVSSVMTDEASAKAKSAAPAKPSAKSSAAAAEKSAEKSDLSAFKNKTNAKAAAKTTAKAAVKKRAPSAKS